MQNLSNLISFLNKYYINKCNYFVGGYKEECICIEAINNEYIVFIGEKAFKHNLSRYNNFNYAVRDFIKRLVKEDEEKYKELIDIYNKEYNNGLIVNFSNENVIIDTSKKSIFLAGPTRRNSNYIYSWRKEAIDILESLDFKGIVYIPECFGDYQFNYDNQVLWERKGLENAKKIVFWIPRKLPNMLGLTTNIEFGMYLARNPEKIVYGRPIDSDKNTYLDWLIGYEINKTPLETLDETLKESLK